MASNEEVDEAAPGPPKIEFNDGYTDLKSLENGSGLPQVARYLSTATGAESGPAGSASDFPLGLKIYSDQPVLLYTKTCKRHARARTIYHDKQGPYFEVGQTLDIPEDFDGWFEVVPPDFGRGPVFRTIGQVAETGARKFFTRTNLRVIRVDEGNDKTDDKTDTTPEADDNSTDDQKAGSQQKEQNFKERKIAAGSVLVIKGSFAAKWQTTAKTGLIKKKNTTFTTVEITYLKCMDIDGMEVLIPMTTRGKFNLVYETGVKDLRTVYRMKDILTNLQLPIKIRMIYGKAPVVPCIFTGMLVVKRQSKEDRIVASTVLNKRNVLFELPVNTKCHVQTAMDEEQYENMRTYIDANKLCKKYALSYGSLIKLSPEIDTDQKMIQHIPTEKQRKTRDESLKNLDLITNISLTDDEPLDYFMESSDSDSVQGTEMAPLGVGQMMELREIEMPKGQTISSV